MSCRSTAARKSEEQLHAIEGQYGVRDRRRKWDRKFDKAERGVTLVTGHRNADLVAARSGGTAAFQPERNDLGVEKRQQVFPRQRPLEPESLASRATEFHDEHQELATLDMLSHRRNAEAFTCTTCTAIPHDTSLSIATRLRVLDGAPGSCCLTTQSVASRTYTTTPWL